MRLDFVWIHCFRDIMGEKERKKRGRGSCLFRYGDIMPHIFCQFIATPLCMGRLFGFTVFGDIILQDLFD